MARAERQQEAFAQDQAAKMQRREAAQEAQREENKGPELASRARAGSRAGRRYGGLTN
jgi:hypothetical protein